MRLFFGPRQGEGPRGLGGGGRGGRKPIPPSFPRTSSSAWSTGYEPRVLPGRSRAAARRSNPTIRRPIKGPGIVLEGRSLTLLQCQQACPVKSPRFWRHNCRGKLTRPNVLGAHVQRSQYWWIFYGAPLRAGILTAFSPTKLQGGNKTRGFFEANLYEQQKMWLLFTTSLQRTTRFALFFIINVAFVRGNSGTYRTCSRGVESSFSRRDQPQ